MTEGTQAIKFGTWLRDNRDATLERRFNGSFTFADADDYTGTLNGLLNVPDSARWAAR